MPLTLIAANAALLAGLAVPAGTSPVALNAILAGQDTNGNTFRVFQGSGGIPYSLQPYGAGFTGGIRVALGDVDGDGLPDIITAPGSGAPTVRVHSGFNGALIDSFDAYAPTFLGGVYVAAGDVNSDGRADIITGTGATAGSTPHVKVFDGRSGAEIRSFLAYGAGFAGGVTVAAGDVNGDGRADIITGTSTAASHVKAFDGRTSAELRSFFAYAGFNGGVYVAGGDLNGDGREDIITGAAAGGAPHVKVFSGVDLAEIASFFAYTPGFTGGVRVGATDLDGDRDADIITGPGAGMAPTIARFLGPGATPGATMLAFDPAYTGGLFVTGTTFQPILFRDGFEAP
jgi:hypothetical protein